MIYCYNKKCELTDQAAVTWLVKWIKKIKQNEKKT